MEEYIERRRERNPIREVMCLSNLIKRNLDGARAERDDGVTLMHGLIIVYVSQNIDRDVFQRDIEKVFSYRRSTASTILALMEEKGLIERHSVPYDARLKKLVLTDRAKALAADWDEDRLALEQIIMNGVTAKEIEDFLRVLDKFRANLKENCPGQ